MKTINIDDLKTLIEKDEVVIVDVREKEENMANSIKSSVSIPLGEITESKLPNCSGKKLVLHCGSGGRSSRACAKLLSENPDIEVYNLEGGIKGWIKAGNEVISKCRNIMPIKRQILLIVGISLIALYFVGYLINPKFFVFTGLIALALIIAGSTGFCLLEKCLSQMPWNKNEILFKKINNIGNTSSNNSMTIDRQVLLTVGILTVLCCLLGYGYSVKFFILTGLIGVGLAFAGATGFCGLAMFLAKMPWNKDMAGKSCLIKR